MRALFSSLAIWFALAAQAQDQPLLREPVEGQPLAANVSRVMQALELLGAPLTEETMGRLQEAVNARDADRLQELLDPQVSFLVSLNPESRVKVQRGPAKVLLQQAGFAPVLVKIINHSSVTKELRIISPQAGQVYAGMSPLSAQRMERTSLKETGEQSLTPGRFLELEMYTHPPLLSNLNGLSAEYALALIYSSEAGQREVTIGFDLGQNDQDLGFRGEIAVLCEIRPALRVKLNIVDSDGTPTVARLTFRDKAGRIFPPQSKRLAPDFYFQPQIYRRSGDSVVLPPGSLTVEYSRGPEYRRLRRTVDITDQKSTLNFKLERWINLADYGFYSGDHHIHGAGCAHYTSPTEGVTPEDMFLQVKGEGLNVGCVLTWGPCFDYQHRFFAPTVNQLSDPSTLMKSDLEISGFGSEALGHVCLLNLKDQTYPGSEGTKTKGWPTWTLANGAKDSPKAARTSQTASRMPWLSR